MAPLNISYDAARRSAILSCAGGTEGSWFGLLIRTLRDRGVEVAQGSISSAVVPWGQFLGSRAIVNEIRVAYGIQIVPDTDAARLLREAAERITSYGIASTAVQIPEQDVRARLRARGFIREPDLTPEQLRNISRISSLPAAATFSVPGAGKTTEALAYYILRALQNETLLVIAPKNALGAWDEQLTACLGPTVGQFLRLRGGEGNIEELLRSPQRFMVITYQQLARDRVPRLIADFIAAQPVFVFVDESHRIKGRGITSTTVRDLAYLPVGKLIMSGTPMPQSVADLIPQFEFLYPEVEAQATNVIDRVRPVFVRTTKAELGLPEPQRFCMTLPMRPAQRRIYDLMKTEVARQAEITLTARDRNAFRALGRSVMRILQLVSNPALLVSSDAVSSDLISTALAEGDSTKLEYACRRTRQLVGQGKKVLVWSAFRDNVETIAFRLTDLGAVYIHGGVDAGTDDDDETREGRIRRFHEDDNCWVMVANPAAAGEGISLHMVCHNAIYVDRTYNSAHYLQSEDRIHRLGTTVAPIIEIIECADSIDQSVRFRLDVKTQQMAAALNDPSLNITPRVVDFDERVDEDADEDPTLGMNLDDVRSILDELGRGAA
jgi:hypothetical protein